MNVCTQWYKDNLPMQKRYSCSDAVVCEILYYLELRIFSPKADQPLAEDLTFVFQQLKNIYHFLVAMLFHALYGFPARKLKVIGVTGTDGKTTTCSLIYHILKSSGRRASVITSVSAVIAGMEHDTGFHVTTPDPHEIPRYMAQAVRAHDEYFVLEVTSHALDQHRVAGVHFVTSGITNITHEHLQYHGDLNSYVRAKARIATMSDITLVNADQPDIVTQIREAAPDGRLDTFGLSQPATFALDLENHLGIPMTGYNRYNYLLAYALCRILGLREDEIVSSIRSFVPPPGRMEIVYAGEFTVISDFAHTPNAISNALDAVSDMHPHHRRIIHVFGAAALRDDAKRPMMGRSSAKQSDIIILTEEDYRTEDPARIFTMIEEGIHESKFALVSSDSPIGPDTTDVYMKILDREHAITRAVQIACPGDIVIITGKGVEKSLCRGTTEYPYDERRSILNALQARGISVRTSSA